MNACREAAELLGSTASRTRPERVSRYFALSFRGLALFVARSITSTAPAITIFAALAGSKNRFLRSEWNLGLVDFDHAFQKRTIPIDHRAAKRLRPKASGLVGDAKLVRQLQCRHTVGVGCQQVRRPEPGLQRQLGAMQDRAGGHQRLAAAVGTFQETATTCHIPRPPSPSARADIPFRPLLRRRGSHKA